MAKAYPYKAIVLAEDVRVEYHDGAVIGDVIRTAVGNIVLWTGRSVRPLPPEVRRQVEKPDRKEA